MIGKSIERGIQRNWGKYPGVDLGSWLYGDSIYWDKMLEKEQSWEKMSLFLEMIR